MDEGSLQLILLLAFGLLQLFFGYPLFRLLVVLAGAAIGFANGPLLLTSLTGRPVEPWMAATVAAIAAVLLGLLAWLAFWAVVFLWGASLGFAAVDSFTRDAILPILGALVVGVVAVAFQRVLIVVLTALSGAWLAVASGAALLGVLPARQLRPEAWDPWLWGVALALAVVGAVAQFRRAVPPSRV